MAFLREKQVQVRALPQLEAAIAGRMASRSEVGPRGLDPDEVAGIATVRSLRRPPLSHQNWIRKIMTNNGTHHSRS